MRPNHRLFELIQLLRVAPHPVTAAALAEKLEVNIRTVYRDIAALQARRIPIEGEAGIGYVLRRGFDLPPLMFTLDEIEAIAVGMRLINRTGDAGLQQAAGNVLSKITVVLPDVLREHLGNAPFFVSDHGARTSDAADLASVRDAIRAARKMRITYLDEHGRRTERTIWPIAVAYYVQATLIAAWCELRQDYRHFRTDRIVAASVLHACYDDRDGQLMQRWLAMMATARQAPAAKDDET